MRIRIGWRAAALCALGAAILSAGRAAADSPRKTPVILFAGDSLAIEPGQAATRRLSGSPDIRLVSLNSIGTGLSRPDIYNWQAVLPGSAQSNQATVVVLFMGANDNQPIRGAAGVARYPSDAWREEYKHRAQALQEMLFKSGVGNVYWIGLPPMRDEALNRHAVLANSIFEQVAERHPNAAFLRSDSVLTLRPGQYSAFVLDPETALPRTVRSADGIHLTRLGSEILADFILGRIREDLGQRP